MGVAALAAVAAMLLFWRLDAVYLWQDEANTAVLAQRLIEHGKPLAYDGVNLLSTDHFVAADPATIGERAHDPRTAVDELIRRGELRADGAWIYHPWGQFVVAAAGIKTFGATTLGARLPFALAALAAVVLLYRLARQITARPGIALLAAALLTANAGWILHARQARYYALSSLLIVVTLVAYDRWRRGARLGAASFVASAWLFFQVDYGTVWPVLAVLFAAACIDHRDNLGKPLAAFAMIAVAIAPFVFFYELWGRRATQLDSWVERLGGSAFNVNRHVVPMVVLAAAAVVLARQWRRIDATERHMVAVVVALLAALLLWVPSVAPAAFLRYVIVAAPLGALLAAWLVARLFPASIAKACAAAAVLAVTPWLTLPLDALAPLAPLRAGAALLRPELQTVAREVFVPHKDPNASVIEWLRLNARPSDEILVNYEDIPLMYYLPNPVRGGIAAFRVEDDSQGPPRFLVLRRSVGFVHWPVFEREVARHDWERIPIDAPDVPWGNNPDPVAKLQDPDRATGLILARRRPSP